MITDELKETVIEMNDEDRKELSNFLLKLKFDDSPTVGEELDRIRAEIKTHPDRFVSVNDLS